MDNTLFDFVAAKQHACREVAKFLGRDDWEVLFNCFLTSPHGFESHENLKDYFDLCGLLETAHCFSKAEPGFGILETCSTGKNTGGCTVSCEGVASRQIPDARKDGPDNIPHAPISPAKGIADPPLPERENVVRIQISPVTRSPVKSSPPGMQIPEGQNGDRRVSVPSACAIPPAKGSTPQRPGMPPEGPTKPRAGTSTSGGAGSAPQTPGAPGDGQADIPAAGPAQPPLKPVRDNLLADKSLYCNEVFSRCCAIYEAEKVRVLALYPGVRETLAELKTAGLSPGGPHRCPQRERPRPAQEGWTSRGTSIMLFHSI